MFDWDKDYDALVRTQPRQGPGRVAQGRASGSRTGFGLIALAVICAGYVGHSAWRTASISADLTAPRGAGIERDLPELPQENLQMLDPTQALRFQTGLRGFSDSLLLTYARHARHDREAASEFMRPYLADAEALIARELVRRGF
ncbi:hypothetical protein [Natronohydrobacter thiooxidans]|uniref:hypothetical protein n=1 Tax=Natronohydrobacter thiooxidans TaxID=87172 RepID=UPI0008FF19CF|nr:hypothetical protein [Natronohydrobacter thiooxidans]